jgi:hypothetical protein
MAILLALLLLTVAPAASQSHLGPTAKVTSPLVNIANSRTSERELVNSIGQLGPIKEPADFWTRIASDSRYSLAHRRHAVFQLFSRHVPAKSKLSALAVKLNGAPWLQPDSIQKMGGLSGPWPFDPGENDSVFRFYILSPQPPYWVIYLHLSDTITADEMLSLVHGKKVSQRVRDVVILHVLYSPSLNKLYGKSEQ